MEELMELRTLIHQGNLQAALSLIDEMEEMSKEDKINKIYSYCIVLLVHLIKQEAEKRTTDSWEVSIRNSVNAIQRTNKRRKAGGTYMSPLELREILTQAYKQAMDNARLEAFGGVYDAQAFEQFVNQTTLIEQAILLINSEI